MIMMMLSMVMMCISLSFYAWPIVVRCMASVKSFYCFYCFPFTLFEFVFLTLPSLHFLLQRVSIACYAKRCIRYRKSVRLSVCQTLALCQNDSSYDHGVFTGGQPHDSSFLVVQPLRFCGVLCIARSVSQLTRCFSAVASFLFYMRQTYIFTHAVAVRRSSTSSWRLTWSARTT